MIHEVSLSADHARFDVPDDLGQRFWHDAGRERLCFDGFMSKATYDRLERLSGDLKYQQALNDLFRICVPDEIAQKQSGSRIGVGVATLVGLLGLAVLTGLAAGFMLII